MQITTPTTEALGMDPTISEDLMAAAHDEFAEMAIEDFQNLLDEIVLKAAKRTENV